MNVKFVIHILIGIAALSTLGAAFSYPLASVMINEFLFMFQNDVYITKKCKTYSIGGVQESNCEDLSPVFESYMNAIMGIIISLMVCIFLEFISMNFGLLVCQILGLLVLCLSITLIILVAVLTSFYNDANNTKITYQLTGMSIGVLVVSCLLVLFELCCNKLVHRVIMAPYKFVKSKL